MGVALVVTVVFSAAGGLRGVLLTDSLLFVVAMAGSVAAAVVSYAVSPTQADLFIATFSAAVAGAKVDYTVAICNAGVSTSANFVVGIYYNQSAAPVCGGAAPDQTQVQTGGLAAGACKVITITRNNATPGDFTGWAFLDSSCIVSEFNETNNVSATKYTVVPTLLPDLQVDSITVSATGANVTYTAQVCNRGKASAAGGTVAGLYFDRKTPPAAACADTPDATTTVSSALAINACAKVTFIQANVAPGAYVAWVMADTNCKTAEDKEDNNANSKGYTVVAPVLDQGVPDFTIPDAGVDAVVATDGTTPVTDGTQPTLDGDTPADGAKPSDGSGPSTDGAKPGTDGSVPGADGSTPASDGSTPSGDGGTVPPSDGGCCAVGGTSDEQAMWYLLGLALMVALRRRRRRWLRRR